jgi:hypothetical protein
VQATAPVATPTDSPADESPAPASVPVSAPSAPSPRPQAPAPNPTRHSPIPWPSSGDAQTTSYQPQLVEALADYFGQQIPTTVTALQQQMTAAMGTGLPAIPRSTDWSALLGQLLSYRR